MMTRLEYADNCIIIDDVIYPKGLLRACIENGKLTVWEDLERTIPLVNSVPYEEILYVNAGETFADEAELLEFVKTHFFLQMSMSSGGGSGTVTSVGLSLPTAIFDISGSPVTSSGTLTATLDNQNANTVFAGPSTGSAATPGFRALVAADIPNLTGSYIQNQDVTDQTADFRITGDGTFGGNISFSGALMPEGNAGTPGFVLTSAGIGGVPTWEPASSSGGSGVTDGDKGDITVSSSGATWTIDGNVISNAKFRQSSGLSVVGRSANSTGDIADITASSDYQVLRRSGTSIGFGAIDLSQSAATTNELPVSRGGTGSSTANEALNNLLPDQTGNGAKVLTTDGTNVSWEDAPGEGGGSSSLTSTYIGYGNGSNVLTGTADMTRNSAGQLLLSPSSGAVPKIGFLRGAAYLDIFVSDSSYGGYSTNDAVVYAGNNLALVSEGGSVKLCTRYTVGGNPDTRIEIKKDGVIVLLDHTGAQDRVLEVDSSGELKSEKVVTSGTFTPTATAVTNCSGVSATDAMYMRVGDIVTFSGSVLATVGTTSIAYFDLTLPIASSISGTGKLKGIAVDIQATNSTCVIRPTSSGNKAEVFWSGISGEVHSFDYHITYEIV